MPTTSEVTDRSATTLAADIAAGLVTATDVVNAHIARIERVNRTLNAVVVTRFDEARAEAREIDRRRAAGESLPPLAGVPITVKECLDLAGTPSTFGIDARRTHRATADDAAVARLRAAGAIVVGKTNVAQLLLYIESDNPVYGRTSNPWNSDRTPGGSSGGEGAIIAARGSALGIGTDVGGSVRVPAAWCGIASLKPTAGRCPDPGRLSMPIGELAIASQRGILARTVADVALGTHIIAGTVATDGTPYAPIGDHTAIDVRTLRIGVMESDDTFPATAAVRRGVREAAEQLRAAGATITPWRIPDLPHAEQLFFGLLTNGGGTWMTRALEGGAATPQIAFQRFVGGRGRTGRALLGAAARAFGQRSLATFISNVGDKDADAHWRLVEALMHYRERVIAALDAAPGGPLDAILSPVNALAAFRHGASKELGLAGPYTLVYNALGFPAGVVPVTRVRPGEDSGRAASRDLGMKRARATEIGSVGLPVGVQVGARPWREDIALSCMAAIERGARAGADFPDRPPTV